jgi:NAD(P)-dependent dehydrogenase (short-subunit alcohol dehydrogenase family)
VVERVAVVTGANRGIGLAIVRALARGGLRVVLTARDAEKGESARASLSAEGLEVAFHALDVREASQAHAVAAWVERESGRLDVLVNNAGVLPDPKGARAATVELAVLREALETNAVGALAVAQACLPLMRRGGYGRIVNVSSELGQLAAMGTGTPAYRVSKAALNAVTRTLAAELAGTNIKVNAMSPGWVRSDMGGPSAPRSLEQGADTAVWLATLPDDGPSGGFFKDRGPIAW